MTTTHQREVINSKPIYNELDQIFAELSLPDKIADPFTFKFSMQKPNIMPENDKIKEIKPVKRRIHLENPPEHITRRFRINLHNNETQERRINNKEIKGDPPTDI